jgi:hypothetical protein
VAAPERKLLALLLAAGLLLFAGLPVDRVSLRLCLFKELSSRPCPFCGLTRAVWHGLRGQPAASLGHHPFGWLLAVGLPFACVLLAAPAGFLAGLGRFLGPGAVSLASGFVLFGIARIFTN